MTIKLENQKISIKVKDFGAELASLRSIDDNIEFLWQGDKSYWSEQSPILFPIVGGLPDDKYKLNGRVYKMRNHGFARNSQFCLAAIEDDNAVFRLNTNNTTYEQYPYFFIFDVTYTLIDNTLRIGFTVTNLDHKTMYFSLGAHPGFICPLLQNESISDYYVLFEKAETVSRRIKADGLLTGETEPILQHAREIRLSRDWFNRDAIILDHLKSSWAELRNDKNNHVVRVEFSGFPYLGLWSASDSAPYICIEPWYGVDSTKGDSYDIASKEGIMSLHPGAEFSCEYRIIVN